MLKTQNKIISLFVTFLLIFASFFLVNKSYAAASFPTNGGGSLTTNQTFTLTISANRSTAYNAVTVNATFSNLTYISSSVVGGWTAVSGPTRSGNTVSFSGAILGSSVTGTRNVLSITFKAPGGAGSSSVSISGTVDGTGVGTGSESGSGFVSYTVKAAPTPPPATPTPTPAPNGVNLSSSTHPDQTKWYGTDNVVMNWNKESGVTDFSVSIDTNSNGVPDDTSEGGDTTRTLNGIGEGVYFFHIKAKNSVGWGPTTSFSISIDKSGPDPFTATSIKNNDGSYNIYFATSDKLSGIAQYNVTIDGKEFGATSTGFSVGPGTKKVLIRSIDKAGNARDSELNIETASQTVTPSSSTAATTSPTPSATASTNTNNSSNAILVIALVLTAIYALLITGLYLLDKGYMNRFVRKLNGTKEYGKPEVTEKSPFK